MKKIQISILSLLILISYSYNSYGKNFIIKGTVKDKQTGALLSNANISIEGTSIGTISDENGIYQLDISYPGNYVMQIDYIGYKRYRQSVQLNFDKKVTVNIELRPTVVEGEGVSVTAKAEANTALERETPMAFTKLNLVELKGNYTTGDLPELIQDVPGVWTSSAGLGESEIIVRGFTSDKVRFMVNDIPMNEPEDNRVYWSNWASLSNTAHSIEVHRGPGFSLYGPAAFGGSVHIETMGVGLVPGSSLRVSSGMYKRIGIDKGMRSGQIYNPLSGKELINVESAINYTYSLRLNSGPLYNGKLNLSAFLEYKTGDSYIYGTTYDGYSLGIEAESLIKRHHLRFSFFVSPQAHNQAFVLQDIDLLKTIGREYNRKNHSYQENYYSKPFWSLKHEWNISDKHILVSNAFFTIGNGTDQTLMNDLFDVETGHVDFHPTNLDSTIASFGAQAIYLYEKFGLLSTDYFPMNYDEFLWDPLNQHCYKGESVGRTAINLFSENRDHSWQRRNRRDHKQFGLFSYYQYELNDKFKIIAGAEGRIWRGHREAEVWYLRFSPGINFRGTDVYYIVGDNVQTDQLQSLYNYDTQVNNYSAFSRINFNPFNKLTIQAGGQLATTNMKVIENPIRLLDIGSFIFFEDAYRTSADQINLDGIQKFTADDYKRDYMFFTPWIGGNYNLTGRLNVFSNFATSKKEPAILDWYDFAEGPLLAVYNGKKLKPETATSIECGIGFNSLNLNTKLNYYYSRYNDKIESVVDINEQRRTMNAGNAVFHGLELEIKGQFDVFDFSGTATVAKNRWKNIAVEEIFGTPSAQVVGKVVPFAPEQMFSASFGYRFEPYPTHNYRLRFRLNYWDEYYGTYSNKYIRADGTVATAKLPYFLDLSGQLSFTKKMKKVDLIFRIDVNNIFNRNDNFMRAQYTIDYTRNDDLAEKYNWYVLQAPLFNVFFTSEIAIH